MIWDIDIFNINASQNSVFINNMQLSCRIDESLTGVLDLFRHTLKSIMVNQKNYKLPHDASVEFGSKISQDHLVVNIKTIASIINDGL